MSILSKQMVSIYAPSPNDKGKAAHGGGAEAAGEAGSREHPQPL